MKEALMQFLNERIEWHKLEQARLKQASCGDEAAHQQIMINVYGIFRSTYQAMKYDLDETVKRFAGIVRTWDESHKLASAHGDNQKQLIEEIKIARATEILRRAKETEVKT